ncbi:MAG: HNH endonuclease [Lachnospiraceae bacterium]
MRYIVNVYTKKKRYLRRYHPNKLKKGNSHYFRIYFETERDAKPLIRKLDRKGIPYKAYQEEYARNTNYRGMFFRQTEGPYRCRYCNRRLKEEDVIVDHIIPVKQAMNSRKAQRILSRHHIDNVNQLENLVAACYDCNEEKGTQLGQWVQKGFLGFWKYHLYRALLTVVKIILLSLIIYCVMKLYG